MSTLLVLNKSSKNKKNFHIKQQNKQTIDRTPETGKFFESTNDITLTESNDISDYEGDFLDIFIKKSRKDHFESEFVPLTLEQLEDNDKKAIKSKLSVIPPLPNIAHELINILGDESASSSKVSNIASKDPILAGKLLQLVNSSFFGLRQEVNSIGRAIVLLGFNTVKNFVIQSQLSKVIPKFEKDLFSLENFWSHSLASSVCAYHLSSGITDIQQSILSTIALLHDIGKIAIAFYKPDTYKKFKEELDKNDSDEPTIIIEEKILGVNHALVGYLLAENWELPEYIRKTILYHHHPTFVTPDSIPTDYAKAVTILHFSDLISKLCGLSIDNDIITGIRNEYFSLVGKTPPIESLIDQKTSFEIQKTKYFVKSQMKN